MQNSFLYTIDRVGFFLIKHCIKTQNTAFWGLNSFSKIKKRFPIRNNTANPVSPISST